LVFQAGFWEARPEIRPRGDIAVKWRSAIQNFEFPVIQQITRKATRRRICTALEDLEVRVLLSADRGLFPQPVESMSSAVLMQEQYANLIGKRFFGGDFTTQDAQSGPLINLDDFKNDARFTAFDGSGYATVIIDTGIDLNHPYFGPDADNNGVSDRIVYSYDFSGNDDPDATDFDGHGSNVASIVASSDATNPGMAPGANIIALKVFPDGGGGASFGDIEQALQWVATNAAAYNIVSVNMSLGAGNYSSVTTGPLTSVMASVVAQGVIIVSASGNDFYEYESQQGVGYPSADPNSLSVGAVYDANIGQVSYGGGATAFTTAADRITPFSQRSASLTTIFAPGAPITGANESGGTVAMHGTSQASPHISGIAVLAQQMANQYLGRRLTQNEFATLMNVTGDTIVDGDDENDNVTNTGLSFRRVNVFALAEALYVDTAVYIGDTVGVARQGAFLLDASQNRSWDSVSGGDLQYFFGNKNDVPVSGDWDGDGLDEIGVFRDGMWYLDYNGNGVWDGTGAGDKKYKFGSKNDLPIVGDWNGDGTDEIGTFRKGEWYLDQNGNGVWDKAAGGDATVKFGINSDLPAVGDWNGDGKSDIGVFRAGTWYLDLNGNRVYDGPIYGDAVSKFGTAGDTPIVGDWNNSGKDKLGVYRKGVVFLDVDGSRHWSLTDDKGDATYRFGNPTDRPIVGTWKLNASSSAVITEAEIAQIKVQSMGLATESDRTKDDPPGVSAGELDVSFTGSGKKQKHQEIQEGKSNEAESPEKKAARRTKRESLREYPESSAELDAVFAVWS